MIEEGLVVFNSTHDSIKADNICAERKIDASLIPTNIHLYQRVVDLC